MKIDNITITEEKTYKQLKENLIYLECKVPLFKVDKKVSNLNNNNNNNLEKNKLQNQNKSQEKQKEKVQEKLQEQITEKENIFYDTFK